jgi:hypothetical protein
MRQVVGKGAFGKVMLVRKKTGPSMGVYAMKVSGLEGRQLLGTGEQYHNNT